VGVQCFLALLSRLMSALRLKSPDDIRQHAVALDRESWYHVGDQNRDYHSVGEYDVTGNAILDLALQPPLPQHRLELRTNSGEKYLRAIGLQDGAPAEGLCSFSNCQRFRRPLTPLHRRLCGNFHVSRHNFVVTQLAAILKEAAVGPVSAEDGSPFHSFIAGSAPGQRQRLEPRGRGDLVVRHSTALSTGDATLDSRHWLLDVCFGDPAAASAQAHLHSWHTAGWVAACLESYKHHKYRTPGTPQSATQAYTSPGRTSNTSLCVMAAYSR
jgi:hypothetical protein